MIRYHMSGGMSLLNKIRVGRNISPNAEKSSLYPILPENREHLGV
jgi:hypothetical protein